MQNRMNASSYVVYLHKVAELKKVSRMLENERKSLLRKQRKVKRLEQKRLAAKHNRRVRLTESVHRKLWSAINDGEARSNDRQMTVK